MSYIQTALLAFFTIGEIAAAATSPLVTGNGFGFAVVSLQGRLQKHFTHPYRFESMNPRGAEFDAKNTANLIRSAEWASRGLIPSKTPEVSYLDESHIIQGDYGFSRSAFFMPFGLQRNVLVAIAPKSTNYLPVCLKFEWEHPIKSRRLISMAGIKAERIEFKKVAETLILIPLNNLSAGSSRRCGNGVALLILEKGESAMAAMHDFVRWRNGLDAGELVKREVRQLERWRVKPKVQFKSSAEKRLWRQSETILRMSQIREPFREGRKSYGLMLASLPDGEWFTPWVRDMAFAVSGLARMGHQNEAREAVSAYLMAGPVDRMQNDVRGVPYQVSTVRYFGDGSEDADYSGQPYRNVEFDSWGLALWAIAEYFDEYKDLKWLKSPGAHGTMYETARDYVVKPIFANLDPFEDGLIVARDSGCWEQNSIPRMHYAYSTIAVISGLRRFLTLVDAMNDSATRVQIKNKIELLERGFFKAYVSGLDIRGTIEPSPKNEMDGALLEAINTELVRDPAIIERTLERLEVLKTGSGGYRRVTGDTDYEKHEFVFIDFMLARIYLRQGRLAAAESVVDPIVERSLNDNGFIPEMFVSEKSDVYQGEIGDPAASVPMVGYGAGIFMVYLTERSSHTQVSDFTK